MEHFSNRSFPCLVPFTLLSFTLYSQETSSEVRSLNLKPRNVLRCLATG